MAADTRVEIGARPIPQEPMYIIANLGMSTNFGTVDLEHLTFPATMKIDYIRVYQDPNNINYGCNPDDFPTEAYINAYVLFAICAAFLSYSSRKDTLRRIQIPTSPPGAMTSGNHSPRTLSSESANFAHFISSAVVHIPSYL